MATFTLEQPSSLSVADAWARVTDWPEHGRWVPLTRITVDPPPPTRVGTVFTARTAVGPVGFDDPMEVVLWEPPSDDGADTAMGRCRMEKRGSVVTGWAVITVEPRGQGSLTRWVEDVQVWKLPRLFDAPTVLSSRLLFGRVLAKLLDP